MRRTCGLLAVALICAMPRVSFACAVCGGRSDSALAEGMNMGILTLLGVVGFVLSGVAAFGIYLARRSAAVNRRRPDTAAAFEPETQRA